MHPPTPLPEPRAPEPLTARLGLPVSPRVRARPPRALPGGKKEKPCRRSARAHSPPPLRITAGGEAGSGTARRGGSGEVEAQSAQLPSLDPKGTQNAGWRKAGGGSCALGGVGGRGAPQVPGHQLLSGRSGHRSRRRRGSAPPIPPACAPSKRKPRGRPAQKVSAEWLGGGGGGGGPWWTPGKGEVRAKWGGGDR